MLVVENITKTYPGGVQALQGVSMEIAPGVFGLLGPNGAGKTTLMRIIATLLEPDEGRVLFDGLNVHEYPQELRRRLGYLPQDFGLYDHMPAETFLKHYAELKGYSGKERDEAVRNLLQLVRLWEVRRRRLGSFSGGMRRRFGIAMALLGDPDLLIVTNPPRDWIRRSAGGFSGSSRRSPSAGWYSSPPTLCRTWRRCAGRWPSSIRARWWPGAPRRP